MPRLPTYSAKLEGGAISGGRRATAEDAGAVDITGAVRSVQNAAEGYLSAVEEDESRKVLVKQAEIRAKYSKRLDDAVTTGEDLANIRQELDNDLSAVTEGLQTRKGQETAQLHAANTGAFFDGQINSLAVTRARIGAKLDGQKFLNNEAQTLTTNPSYLPIAEKNIDDFVRTYEGRLSPEYRAELADTLKKRANFFAVRSAIRQSANPEEVLTQIEAGKWNLAPEAIDDAVNSVKTEVRGRRADEERAVRLAEKEERDRVDAARGQMLDGIINGTVRWSDIRDNPAFAGPQGANAKKEMFIMMEARNKEMAGQERKSDPTAVRNLWMAIHAPDGDSRKIYNADAIFEAVQAGRVNTTDANQLNALVANQKDENNRSIGSRLSSLMGTVGRAFSQDPRYIGQPALVAEIQMDYQARVFDRVKQLRDAKKDPNEAFNPASKEYVGSKEFIQGSVESVTGRTAGRFEVGQIVERDGRAWEFKGGNPGEKANWVDRGPANKAPVQPIRGPN